MDKFAHSNKEAENRYRLYKSKDPFPDISPSLLNSADIEDYVAVTGMIYPFDDKKLISASYEVPLEGEVHFWSSNNDKRTIETVSQTGGYTLESNSIAYVWLNTHFRIPNYIALRFNLVIKHVHRGILLGTGPLVDPGFQGRLLIPLHNLTANPYRISRGDGLIWMEFTKISKNVIWSEDERVSQRIGRYKAFPIEKTNLNPDYYFERASGGSPIRSSIPKIIQDAAQMANSAELAARSAAEEATTIKEEGQSQIQSIKDEWSKQISRIQLITLIASVLAIGAMIATIVLANRTTLILVENSIKYVNELHSDLQQQRAQLLKRISTIEDKFQAFEKEYQKAMGTEKKIIPSSPAKASPSMGSPKND